MTLLLADLTKRFVEDRFRTPQWGRPLKKPYLLGAVGMAVVVGLASLQLVEVHHDQAQARQRLSRALAGDNPCFGARALDHLEQTGRQRLVRQAVTVVSMPPSRKDIDLPSIQRHFASRTRAVLLAPYERLLDSGEPIRYAGLSAQTREAWLRVAAEVAGGL